MYCVYTEILGDNGVERWFYGLYKTEEKANDVAYELGGNYPVFHCVCKAEEVEDFKINNYRNNGICY